MGWSVGLSHSESLSSSFPALHSCTAFTPSLGFRLKQINTLMAPNSRSQPIERPGNRLGVMTMPSPPPQPRPQQHGCPTSCSYEEVLLSPSFATRCLVPRPRMWIHIAAETIPLTTAPSANKAAARNHSPSIRPFALCGNNDGMLQQIGTRMDEARAIRTSLRTLIVCPAQKPCPNAAIPQPATAIW